MASPIVLVTGATGYVGSAILAAIINHPTVRFNVRLALRKESQAPAFLEAYPEAADRIKFYFIDSIEKEGALDEAAAGADLFMHGASPVIFDAKDNRKDVLDPAINGALVALKSAVKAGTIKSFCFMSSISAVLNFSNPGGPEKVYSPSDKNPMTYEEAADVPTFGPAAHGMMVYGASKGLSEQAAWDFVAKEKPSFAFSSVCPEWCLGPNYKVGAKTPAEVGTSFYMTYTYLVDAPHFTPAVLPQYVDIRDVARTCVGALLHPEISAGKRYITSGGKFTNEKAAAILCHHFPEQKDRIAKAEDNGFGATYSVDGSLAERDFGFKYIDLENSIKDYGKQVFDMLPTRPVTVSA